MSKIENIWAAVGWRMPHPLRPLFPCFFSTLITDAKGGFNRVPYSLCPLIFAFGLSVLIADGKGWGENNPRALPGASENSPAGTAG
jgi:hypothetical protein